MSWLTIAAVLYIVGVGWLMTFFFGAARTNWHADMMSDDFAGTKLHGANSEQHDAA
jgi:hypothetical protein